MAPYRCKNCGKYVAKGTIHKYLHADLPTGKCHVIKSSGGGGRGATSGRGRLQNQRVRFVTGRGRR
jgi:hypothetical protein